GQPRGSGHRPTADGYGGARRGAHGIGTHSRERFPPCAETGREDRARRLPPRSGTVAPQPCPDAEDGGNQMMALPPNGEFPQNRPRDIGAFRYVPSLTTEQARVSWYYRWPYGYPPGSKYKLPDLWRPPERVGFYTPKGGCLMRKQSAWSWTAGAMVLSLGLAVVSAAPAPQPKVRQASSQLRQPVGAWDITVQTAQGKAYSWLEIERSGATLVGRFVGTVGSVRPISRVEFSQGTLRFTLPPQYEDRDLQF